jgi:hypothetical protein
MRRHQHSRGARNRRLARASRIAKIVLNRSDDSGGRSRALGETLGTEPGRVLVQSAARTAAAGAGGFVMVRLSRAVSV